MPVEFLADDKASAYGSSPATVSRAQLAEYFHLAADREALGSHRGDHNRLGFALQLCTVRFFRTFLVDPIDVRLSDKPGFPIVEACLTSRRSVA